MQFELGPLEIFHKTTIFHIWADEEPRGFASRAAGAIQQQNVAVSECLPNTNFTNEQGPGSGFCENLDGNGSTTPGALVNIREEANANLFVSIDLIPAKTTITE
jgi:hypothetical protein